MPDTDPIRIRLTGLERARVQAIRDRSPLTAPSFPATVYALFRAGLEATPLLPTGEEIARLAAAMKAADITQEKLAKSLGYEHRSSIGNILLGKAAMPGNVLAWVMGVEALPRKPRGAFSPMR